MTDQTRPALEPDDGKRGEIGLGVSVTGRKGLARVR